MCAQSPYSSTGRDELLESQFQRYARVLGFAKAFARAKKTEFEILWLKPGKFGPKAQDFVRRIDALAARATEGETLLGYAKGQPTRQAFTTLGTFDLAALATQTNGLESLAAELKAHPGIQAAIAGELTMPDLRASAAPTTGPLPAEGQASTTPLEMPKINTARLGDLMRSWIAPTPVVPAGPTPKEIAAQRVERAHDQNKRALDAAIDLVQKVLKNVSPRMHVLEVAMSATGLPGKPRTWEAIEDEIPRAGKAAGFTDAQIGWLYHLADLFTTDPKAVQAAHVAIVQWSSARIALGEAEVVRDRVLAAPPGHSAQHLRDFNLGRFRASVFPLSHLHLSFKGLTLLQDMFPEPT